MAFKVIYKGLEVVCDTFADLDALAEHAKGSKGNTPRKQSELGGLLATETAGNPKSIKEFLAALNKKASAVYEVIVQSNTSISDTELRNRLKIESNNSLAGMIAGITRAAKKTRWSPDAVLTKRIVNNKPGERAYSYSVPPAVRDQVQAIMFD